MSNVVSPQTHTINAMKIEKESLKNFEIFRLGTPCKLSRTTSHEVLHHGRMERRSGFSSSLRSNTSSRRVSTCGSSILFPDSPVASPDLNPAFKHDTVCTTISSEQNDRIVINVGGFRHETFRSTLRMFPDTRLGWIAIKGNASIDAYDHARDEYFFDRHPDAFAQIINFYRTGKLHAPSDICGPLFEEELSYWGLDEKAMEPCCWSKYTEHRDAEENLKVFDNHMLNPQEEETIQNLLDPHLSETTQKQTIFARFQKKTWMMFEKHNSSLSARVISIVSLMFILLSVLSLCFHSMLVIREEIDRTHKDLLLALDIACFLWFTIELTLRFVCCPSKITFVSHIMNIIDLITIVPYIGHFIQRRYSNYVMLRPQNHMWEWFQIVSCARLFRLFRFFRLSTGLQILKHTLIASSKELLLLLLLLAIPVAIFATIVYYCESLIAGTKFRTIPESFWWAIITMTTVGYGDMSPETTIGKTFGAVCALCSVLIVALPVSIIGNNFTLFYHYAQARLKHPIHKRSVLVGAANALVAEPNQLTQMSFCSEASNLSNSNIKPRERSTTYRTSLYASAPRQTVTRRAKSEGNILAFNRDATFHHEANVDGRMGEVNEAFDGKSELIKEETVMNGHVIPQTVISNCETEENTAPIANGHCSAPLEKTNHFAVNGDCQTALDSCDMIHEKDIDGDILLCDEGSRRRSNNHLYVPHVELQDLSTSSISSEVAELTT